MERHGFKDADFLSSPIDQIVSEDEKGQIKKTATLYLAAKDGNLVDAPEEHTLKDERRRSL